MRMSCPITACQSPIRQNSSTSVLFCLTDPRNRMIITATIIATSVDIHKLRCNSVQLVECNMNPCSRVREVFLRMWHKFVVAWFQENITGCSSILYLPVIFYQHGASNERFNSNEKLLQWKYRRTKLALRRKQKETSKSGYFISSLHYVCQLCFER